MGYVQNHGVVKIRRYGKIMGYVQNHGVVKIMGGMFRIKG